MKNCASCIKEWCNGYEISIAIDNNLEKGFRAWVIVFSHADSHRDTHFDDSHISATGMAKLILEAREYASKLPAGKIPEFKTTIERVMD